MELAGIKPAAPSFQRLLRSGVLTTTPQPLSSPRPKFRIHTYFMASVWALTITIMIRTTTSTNRYYILPPQRGGSKGSY